MKLAYAYLFFAIISEVIATSALKASEGFTRLLPSLFVLTGYILSLYFLSLVMKTIPIGISYAIWSGIGIALITLTGAIYFQQVPDLPALVGIVLIISGVIIIQVFSKMTHL